MISNSNENRAIIGLFLRQGLGVAVILGLVALEEVQLAAIYAFIDTGVTLAFLAYKAKSDIAGRTPSGIREALLEEDGPNVPPAPEPRQPRTGRPTLPRPTWPDDKRNSQL